MTDPTLLVRQAVEGDDEAVAALFDLLYGDLRGRARGLRARWHGNLTMNTTALVNEAYLKLAGGAKLAINDRAHFLAIASRAMRQVLLDYARKASSQKRGGEGVVATLSDELQGPVPAGASLATELLDLEAALSVLERENPNAARVVECRFFGGMTVQETSVALGISEPTVKRRWAVARSRLYRSLARE